MSYMLDALYEVLCLSPAYLQCKFKCVSTEVDFSREPSFCGKQARNMLQQGDMHIFGFPVIAAPMGAKLYHLFDNGPSPGLPKEFMELFWKNWRILASWNGLVVVEFEMVDIKPPTPCICNPVTGSWALLRSPMEEYSNPHELEMHMVFVPCDTDGNDFKLICIAGIESRWGTPYVMKEYNLVENNWQVLENNIEFGARQMNLDRVAVVSNTLYMMSDNYDYGEGRPWRPSRLPYVTVYSLVEHKYSILPLPHEVAHDPFHGKYEVFTFGSRWTSTESACLVRYIGLTFTFWTSVDGTPGSWNLIHRLNVGELGIIALENELGFGMQYEDDDDPIRSFALVNGNCFIFATRVRVYGYNVSEAYPWRFKVLGENSTTIDIRFISYSSTFRPVDLSQTTTFSDVLAAL